MVMATRHRLPLPLPSYLAAALFLAFTLAPLAAGDPLGQLCGTNANYTANGIYQANIQSLAGALPKNTSLSQNLFATATIGTVPDMVYALALCRGDASAYTCGACVSTAFKDAQQLCPYNKDATLFYDPCLLSYSNQNFLNSTKFAGTALVLMNVQNVTVPFEVFDDAVEILVKATANAAANSPSRFGTAVEPFQNYDSKNPAIYGLAQCTPDMTPAECRSCLSAIIQLAPKYFSRKQGGRILSVRCNYRYEQYSFFYSPLQLPDPTVGPPPVPAPTHAVVNGAPLTTGGRGNKAGKILAITLPIVGGAMLATVVICSCLSTRKRKTPGKSSLPDLTNSEDIHSIDSLFIDLSTLRTATENFYEANRLGEGGFGAVYKGILPNDREIAVKRLSKSSQQGMGELKNELVLVAKLQHKNLVRLIGVCLEDQEKLLVYEYMPNKSLDTILFDRERSGELDWGKRSKIVEGIARGLQYLHEDSQVKIIHRDMKASNVLLDYNFNPKISDFGLARLFGSDQSQDVTNRVVGTYGYMAPEYAMCGHYSIKSDVFSFGVLILEIVTGRRNGGSYYSYDDCAHLLSLVWEHWTTGTVLEIMDSSLSSLSPRDQMLKCIHIGLLCVQDDPADRPMMSTVNIMLSSTTVTLQAPSRPAFCIQKGTGASQSASRWAMSLNDDVPITELEPR